VDALRAAKIEKRFIDRKRRKGERRQRAVMSKTRRTAYTASADRDVQVDEAIPAKAGWRGEFWCG
jgi:hypothetical protein